MAVFVVRCLLVLVTVVIMDFGEQTVPNIAIHVVLKENVICREELAMHVREVLGENNVKMNVQTTVICAT